MDIEVYEWTKNFYKIGAIKIWQVKKFVELKKLTETQYKEITGYDYPNPQ